MLLFKEPPQKSDVMFARQLQLSNHIIQIETHFDEIRILWKPELEGSELCLEIDDASPQQEGRDHTRGDRHQGVLGDPPPVVREKLFERVQDDPATCSDDGPYTRDREDQICVSSEKCILT